MKPTGLEAYLEPKELIPLGAHPLSAVWENSLGPALDAYLLRQQVQVSLLNSCLIGVAGETSSVESTTALSLARPAWTPH